MSPTVALKCKICGAPSQEAGTKRGRFQQREFHLRHCPQCRFSFIADPWTDYPQIYSEAYYRGEGADPLVDYLFELDHPDRTIRQYEWRGILKAVGALVPLNPETRWLDFGCGNGGLVRFCRSRGLRQTVGFEEGAIVPRARAVGTPILDHSELGGFRHNFDVVTAIEVLEHVFDPLEVLAAIRGLLKPNGLFFYTTGNAAPYRSRLPEWAYVRPEIHISFYEPETLRQALTGTGFRPEFRAYLPGFTDIIRFKILKNLKMRECAPWERVLPWPLLSRVADWRFRVTGHPVGWAV